LPRLQAELEAEAEAEAAGELASLGEEEEEEEQDGGEGMPEEVMPEESVADSVGDSWEKETRTPVLEQELYALLALQHMGALCIYDEQN
jgi:hypothetical protein